MHLLKTSENREDFLCFHGVEKRCTENKWVKDRMNERLFLNKPSFQALDLSKDSLSI